MVINDILSVQTNHKNKSQPKFPRALNALRKKKNRKTGKHPGRASPLALQGHPLQGAFSGADQRYHCWKLSCPPWERWKSPRSLFPPHGRGPLPPDSNPVLLQTVSKSYCCSWEQCRPSTGCWAPRCRMTGGRSKAAPRGPGPQPPGGLGRTGSGGGPGDAGPVSPGLCSRSSSPSSCSGWSTKAWSAVLMSPRQMVYPGPWLHEDTGSPSGEEYVSAGHSVTPRKQKTRRKDMKLLFTVRAHQSRKCDSRNLTLPTKWSRPKHLIGNIYKKIIGNIYPGGSESKASACNAGDPGLIPGLGRSPGGGNGHPLEYSFLENPMDGGAWWVTVHRNTKSQTQLKRLSTHNNVYLHQQYVRVPSSPHPQQHSSLWLFYFYNHHVFLKFAKGIDL